MSITSVKYVAHIVHNPTQSLTNLCRAEKRKYGHRVVKTMNLHEQQNSCVTMHCIS